jgi:hypothetical protein
MVPITLVAALAENGVIGRDNGLPWRLKSDMVHFRAITMGKPVVMGRKTFLSIGRPLPGRTTIVVSRDGGFAAPGIVVAPSMEAALTAARGDALRRGASSLPAAPTFTPRPCLWPSGSTLLMCTVRSTGTRIFRRSIAASGTKPRATNTPPRPQMMRLLLLLSTGAPRRDGAL